MKKGVLFLILTGFICLSAALAPAQRLETQEIDRVRTRAVVDNAVLESIDLAVIDAFMDRAFDEWILTQNNGESVNIRITLTERRGVKPESQYSVQYRTSCEKYMQQALENLAQRENSPQKQIILRDMMILAADMNGPAFVRFGLGLLSDTEPMVRYWATAAATGPAALAAFGTDNPDTALAGEVMDGLAKLAADSAQAETLRLAVLFIDKIKDPRGIEILNTIADKRIQAYRDWKVDNEMLEINLLDVMANKINQAGSSQVKQDMARRFGQVYSFVIQRYLTGKGSLSKTTVSRLESVIVSIEQMAVVDLLGRAVNNIKTSIEKGGQTLQTEHDNLLGADARRGELQTKFNFDYNGSAAPEKLPAPPAPETAEGEKPAPEGQG